ncbi:hypothetical protein S83_052100, partial [Arachis hypogaea]
TPVLKDLVILTPSTIVFTPISLVFLNLLCIVMAEYNFFWDQKLNYDIASLLINLFYLTDFDPVLVVEYFGFLTWISSLFHEKYSFDLVKGIIMVYFNAGVETIAEANRWFSSATNQRQCKHEKAQSWN